MIANAGWYQLSSLVGPKNITLLDLFDLGSEFGIWYLAPIYRGVAVTWKRKIVGVF